ncbi:hypothetical protein T01_5030 [Trichinella spiralis]|uniref:Uncharacterized protein n=1 Tax=Trichinella spiralis TaxID=6334 RepID=A0A0V1C2M1_TRISP|nr:hypothetical protein T01_5030 [Trichinella spiralis]
MKSKKTPPKRSEVKIEEKKSALTVKRERFHPDRPKPRGRTNLNRTPDLDQSATRYRLLTQCEYHPNNR